MKTLENLEIGDEVTVVTFGSVQGEIRRTSKVIRVTKTQITIEGGDRFIKRNGYKVGEANKTRGCFTCIEIDKKMNY